MNISKIELDCYARLLKSAIETGGWVIKYCDSCPHRESCKEHDTGGYKLEYINRKKLTSITGVDLINVSPFASVEYSF